MYDLVRMTSSAVPPASVRAASMISRHRLAWAPGSGSTDPSGQIGAVPATATLFPTLTARLNPNLGSKGDPEDTFRRFIGEPFRGVTFSKIRISRPLCNTFVLGLIPWWIDSHFTLEPVLV